MRVEFTSLLASYAKDSLVAIARQQGLTTVGNKKDELVGILAISLTREATIKRNMAALGEADRAVLERLVIRGGEARTAAVRQELLRAGLVEKTKPVGIHQDACYSLQERLDSRSFEDVVARLTMAGLLFSSGSVNRYTGGAMHLRQPGDVVFIPDAVLAQLPSAAALLPEVPEIGFAGPTEAAALTLQRDLYLYWRFVRHNEVTLTTRGLVPKRQVAKIADSLVLREDIDTVSGEHELGRTYFLRRLMEELGLLQQEGGRLLPAAQSRAFLSLPRTERVRRCYNAWLGSARWNELTRLSGITIDVGSHSYRDGAPLQILKARQFVVSLLASLPAERWVPLDHLWRLASLVDSDFLFPRELVGQDIYYSSYYYNRRPSDVSPYERLGNSLGWTFSGVKDDERGWQTVEGGFIAAILREPLCWLGLVDLGFQRGALVAFRLTDLASRLLRGEPLPPAPPLDGRVVIQPNFQVFAFDPLGEDVLAELDRFAELVRADQAIEFRLSRESVYRAQQEGMTVAEIVTFLEAVSHTPLPQNVRRTLEEWESHHERIVVRRGLSLLHSASPDLLDALFDDQSLLAHLGRRLTPTAVIIRDGEAGADSLATALLANGHLPALSRDGEDEAKGAFTVDDDGQIAFRRRLPSIYLWRRLNSLAEQRDGALWLTPASVQRSVSRGLSAEQLIEQLAALHRGPLPAAIADRVKIWARHWGDATLAAITLLRVRDAAVLAELSADPTIGQFLHPYTPQGAVALVHPADIDRLHAALAAKGIPVSEEP